jgi:hypothetical protein
MHEDDNLTVYTISEWKEGICTITWRGIENTTYRDSEVLFFIKGGRWIEVDANWLK